MNVSDFRGIYGDHAMIMTLAEVVRRGLSSLADDPGEGTQLNAMKHIAQKIQEQNWNDVRAVFKRLL